MKQLRPAFMLILLALICFSASLSSAQQPAAVNDPLRSQQWYLTSIHADEAWAIQGAAAVRMGIIDTGYSTHEDLPTIPASHWKDFTADNSPTPKDEIGHGTFVTGQACALTNNARGIAGAAYTCRDLYIARVYKTGNTDVATIIRALDWMTANKVRVLLLTAELNQADPGDTYRAAINRFHAQGGIIVAPAGNSGQDITTWPAQFASVISVASVNRQLKRSSFSNFGSWVTIAAPGEEILGPAPGNTYKTDVGTSKADVFVFATVALMLSRQYCLSRDQVTLFLRQTAQPLAEKNIGAGLVDMNAALQRAAQNPSCHLNLPLIKR